MEFLQIIFKILIKVGKKIQIKLMQAGQIILQIYKKIFNYPINLNNLYQVQHFHLQNNHFNIFKILLKLIS